MKFIKRSHRSSSYERPHVEWECGSRCSGTTCPLGPSIKGECRATCECNPRLVGDSWTCTRSEENGGPCVEGPKADGTCSKPLPPCIPRRTTRALRRRFCLYSVGLTIGLVLLFGYGNVSKIVFSPGEVSRAHGNIGDSCASCHSAGKDGLGGWMHRFLAGIEAPKDNDKCLSCHSMGDFPHTAHNRSEERLEEIRKSSGDSKSTQSSSPFALRVASTALDVSSINTKPLDCVLCHKEHQGRLSNISVMDDRRCQTCHAEQFHSLADGHPKFVRYPHRKKTPIIFDHTSHLNKHMVEDSRSATNCITCHQSDQKGMQMNTASFEKSCAECHHDEIRGEGSAEVGIAFITIPEIDTSSIESAGLFIGVWPEDADGELTPFQSLILEQRGVDIDVLDGVDLFDLSEASPEQLLAAQQIVWLTKKQFFDLATRGQSSMIETLSMFAEEKKVVSLVSGLPPGLINQALLRWMPEIVQEMKGAEITDTKSLSVFLESLSKEQSRVVSAERSDTSSIRDSGVLEEELVSVGGWYIDGFTLLYRPQGHADSFVKNWIDFASSGKERPLAKSVFDSLSRESAPGRCGYCHSVTTEADGASVMKWRSFHPSMERREITDFMHRPHRIKGSNSECEACHKLDTDADYLGNYRNANERSEGSLVSGFMAIEKSTCTECHVSGRAPISCLSCHNYHAPDGEEGHH